MTDRLAKSCPAAFVLLLLISGCEGSILDGRVYVPPGESCELEAYAGTVIEAQCVSCHSRGRPLLSFEAADRATWSEGRWLNAVTRMLNRSMPPQRPLDDALLANVRRCLDQNPLQPDLAPQALCPMPTDPAPSRQLRLGRTAYANALAGLFRPSVVAPARALIDSLPDARVRQFASEQPDVSGTEVETYVNVAAQLAFTIADSPAELAALEPCLGVTPIAASCVQTFLGSFGARVYRRPMQPADLQYLDRAYRIGSAHSPEEGVATVIMTALSDWEFLYLVETSGQLEPGATDLYRVTDHELAARLAFALWESVPDAPLLAAAQSGFTDATLGAQLDRMLGDPRASAALSRFYEQWLGTQNVPPVPSHLGAADPAALKRAIQKELRDFTIHVTLGSGGTYAQLLTDRTAFIADAPLAQLYGVPLPTGGATAQLPADRAGILTRAAWLMTAEVPSSNAGHIIKRGVRMAGIVCDTLPAPDPALFPAQDPADPSNGPQAAIRQRFWEKTSQSPCVGCHTRIDAWGGAFGHYSSAGKYLATETVFGQSGAADVELTIDATAFPNFDSVRDAQVNGGAELSARLGGSVAGPQCMAKQLVTSFSGRSFTGSDGCWVEHGARALQTGSIRDAIKALLLAPQFRLKKL